MNFFDHKDIGNHLLQLCPKVVKLPVYMYIYPPVVALQRLHKHVPTATNRRNSRSVRRVIFCEVPVLSKESLWVSSARVPLIVIR
jgi:hypothetical protein